MLYNGIEIAEWLLLFYCIASVVIILIMAALLILVIAVSRQNKNAKEEARLERLRERADSDPIAAKQLKRLERKRLNRKERDRDQRLETVFICVILAGLMVASTVFLAIPCWTDYVIKDYAVYEGEFEVYRQRKRTYTRLEDGTTLSGGLRLDYGYYEGKLVYSKRSEILLGSNVDN